MVLKVNNNTYIIFIILVLSDNIFRAFIDNDNRNIIILMKKMFYIYSKYLRIKKLYYFMKFYKITEIIKIKDIKSNKYLNNGKKIYSNLYNDYTLRNTKKENMKVNQLYSESELYPFSPLINHSGYTTIGSNNFTPYTSRYSSYTKFNPNKKRSNIIQTFPNRRSILTENSLFDKQNFNNNNYMNNNDIFQKYQNDYSDNNKKGKYEDLKSNYFNNTDYGFYSPINKQKKKKTIHLNRNEDINSQISEYLNNFEKNNKKINLLNPKNIYNSMNNNNDYYPYKRNKSNNNIRQGNKFNIKSKGKPLFLNNNENSYDITRNKEVDNYINKRINQKKNNNNNKDSFSFKKNQINKKPIIFNNEYSQNNNDKNNNKLYNESKDYFYSFNQENNNKNNNKDYSKKNSNASLNPSSLGNEYTKTFYTNKQKTSNNNLNIGGSNINSASSRAMDTQYHFLNGLKMASGEVNEYFYDFNSKRRDKNDDQKSVQSLQSLSDSKILELANHYLPEEDDSVENYQMNNIIYNKKKFIIK